MSFIQILERKGRFWDYISEYLEKAEITEKNKTAIRSFLDFCKARGLSNSRILKYCYNLTTLAKLLGKDFESASKEDMVSLVAKIERSDYSEKTKVSFRVILKRFMKWLRESQGMELGKREYPKEVEWISTTLDRSKLKVKSEILSPEEVAKLANCAKNLRDRALVLVLYESGARIGELLNLKIKDIEFDKYGCLLNLFGKTGFRKVRIVASTPALNQWLQVHPKKEDRESYLFCQIQKGKEGKQMSHEYVLRALKEMAEKAGIQKPVNPHAFRHARATFLAQHLTESEMSRFFGWVLGSKQTATYVHLSMRDLDDKLLSIYGLQEKKEEEMEKMRTVKCPRCGIENDYASQFCTGCGLPLTQESILKVERERQLAEDIGKAILSNEKLVSLLKETLLKELEKRFKKSREEILKSIASIG